MTALPLDALVIDGAGGTGSVTVSANDCVPVPAPLVADSVTVYTPADEVTAPEMRPPEVLRLKPAGRPLAPYEVGELLATI